MDIRDFKNDAKKVAQYLSEQGIEIQHSMLLEALARGFGARNWGTFQGVMRKAELSPEPAATENDSSQEDWDSSKGPMTSEQYVRMGTHHCPFCGSREVEGGDCNIDGAYAWDSSSCNECGASWNTSYQATGYFDAVPGGSSDSSTALKKLRDDAIEDILSDIRARGKKYGFSVNSFDEAFDLVVSSAELLGLDENLTEEDLQEAASRLIG